MRYGQPPESVKRWGVDEFDEAFIIWQGEQEYQQTADDIARDLKERGKNKDSYLLGRDQNFWKRFMAQLTGRS
jgi:hypothetical protein